MTATPLESLRRFRFDAVRVGPSLVADLRDDPASSEIVAAVVRLTHAFGMTVVAGGVETAHQHDEATRLGCDLCQGHYFSRPMSSDALLALIRQFATSDVPGLPVLSPSTR